MAEFSGPLPVWERCVQSSGRPAPRWSPPWRWFQSRGCCSCSDTRPARAWLLPDVHKRSFKEVLEARQTNKLPWCGLQFKRSASLHRNRLACLFSKSILLPSTTKGKFSGSRGLAWIKNSSLQLSRVLKVLGAVTSKTRTQQSAPR